MALLRAPRYGTRMSQRLNPESEFGKSYLVARAAPILSQQWDGGTERVAYIVRNSGKRFTGFWPREQAVAELGRRAVEGDHARYARDLDQMAAALKAAPLDILLCVYLGSAECLIFELSPDDLRAAVAQPVSDAEIMTILDACSRQTGALRLIQQIQTVMADLAEEPIVELEHLRSCIAQHWCDYSTIAMATARARTATNAYLRTRPGQRARLVLEMLAEATAKRAECGVNARGGAD